MAVNPEDLSYSTSHDKKPRQYTEMQKYILDNIITKHNGNAMEAAKAAGYTNPREAVKSLKSELTEIAEEVLAQTAVESTLALREVVTSKDPIPNIKERIQAAKEVLEHTNPKQNKVEHSGEVQTGLFILPSKGATQEDEEDGDQEEE